MKLHEDLLVEKHPKKLKAEQRFKYLKIVGITCIVTNVSFGIGYITYCYLQN